MYDELISEEDYKNVESKDFYDKDILKDYIDEYYDENDDKDAWFNRIKLLADKYGFAKEVKSYKAEPDKYKGHIGDVCELIRVAITSQKQTPDLYEILKIMGKEQASERINLFIKTL